MCTFDFDLPNITSIDWRTVLCFTCWGKHLLWPCWKPGHKPPLRWQACDEESSMVYWDLDLITAVIYWQLPQPPTMAITSWVIVEHRAENPSVHLGRYTTSQKLGYTFHFNSVGRCICGLVSPNLSKGHSVMSSSPLLPFVLICMPDLKNQKLFVGGLLSALN